MIPLLDISFLTVTLADVIDVVVVAAIFYKLMDMLRGTRAFPMLLGLLILFLLAFLTQIFQLGTLGWLIENFQAIWLIAFVILFAPELRRMLAALGQSRIVRYFVKVEEPHIVDEVSAAVEYMSRKGIGALIVLSRRVGLKGIIETGVKMQSEVSASLLETIFFPKSPLHDGAVVIQNGVLEAASCLLPLSQSSRIDPELGTRHRAAVGMSEESDAVVVVISEETSVISLSVGGRLIRNLDASALRQQLTALLDPRFTGAPVTVMPETAAV
jgi:diadenylate cyclase